MPPVARDLWREDDALRFAPPGVGSYRCASPAGPDLPATIEVAPCPNADEESLAALLVATALPGLMWLGGGVILHAAAVLMPGSGRLIGIAGASGAGKSTLLAALVEAGARPAADDSLCLRVTEAGVVASGLPGGWFAPQSDAAIRAFVAVDPARAIHEAPLGAILVLSSLASDRLATIDPLAPLDALGAVLRHRHRPAVPALFGDPRERLRQAAAVARLPTLRWSRPMGSPALTLAEQSWIDGLR